MKEGYTQAFPHVWINQKNIINKDSYEIILYNTSGEGTRSEYVARPPVHVLPWPSREPLAQPSGAASARRRGARARISQLGESGRSELGVATSENLTRGSVRHKIFASHLKEPS